MGRLVMAALALLLASSVAHAGHGPRAVRDRIEASMLVIGTIEVDPQGRVEGFQVDKREALPGHVTRLLDKAIPAWRFEPTLYQGRPSHVTTSMRIRVVAARQGEDAVVLRIAGASFGGLDTGDAQADAQAGARREVRRNNPPTYPRNALRRGVMATVYLLGRVGLDGKMQEAIAEQVNLRYIDSERVMDDLREAFAKASIRAAMKWTYAVPGDVDASQGHWSVRVPVAFTLTGVDLPGYGEWDSYIPGPRRTAWWIEEASTHGGDSYVSGGIYPVGSGLKLLTSLEGNG